MKYFPLRFKNRELEKEFLSKTSKIVFKFYIATLIILGIMSFYSTFINFLNNNKYGGIQTASFLGGITIVLLVRNKFKRIVPLFSIGLGIAILTMNLIATNMAVSKLPPTILIIYYNGFMLGMFHMLLEHLFLKFQVKVFFVIVAVALRWSILPTSNFLILMNSSFIDLANLVIMYYYERNNRTLFKSFYDYRNELAKFKVLLTEHLPHNIIILNKQLDQKLFANNSFTNNLKVETLDQVKDLFSSFKINMDTIDQSSSGLNPCDSTFLGQPELTLQDFLTYVKNDPKDESSIICFNIDFTDPDENKITYEVKVFHLDWDGTPAITIMLNDLTQQQTILALKIADENKDRLLATVSHELRTPINGMLGVTQIIEQEYKDPKLLSYCKSAKVCAKMLLNLVNSILDLAQIRNKCIRLNPTVFKVRDMIEEVESIFRPQCIGKNNIEFIVKVSRGIPSRILSDQSRLMQIIINLLANALKFTFQGKIVLSADKGEQEDEIEFKIEDTGTGIKEEDKPKLFKAFGKLIQTNPKINTQGVGLGLTISNSLVNLLHPKKPENKIEFESTYGKGTTFFFTISTRLVQHLHHHTPEENKDRSDNEFSEKLVLSDTDNLVGFSESIAEYGPGENLISPLLLRTLFGQHNLPREFIKKYQTREANMPLTDLESILLTHPEEKEEKELLEGLDKEERNNTNQSLAKSTALIVDDNPLNLMIASKLLEKLGFTVTTAFNGQEAIHKVKNQDRNSFFKMILMDCQMPVMDGFEATQLLKKMINNGEIPDVSIFALTANDSDDDQKRCMEAGMAGYLSKPLKVEELKKLVKKLANS